MFRRIGRAFKEAWWGIRHHRAMVFSTVVTISITLAILSILGVLIANINQITYDIEEEIQVFVKIDNDVEEKDIEELQLKVSRISGVAGVVYSDADSELTYFIEQYGESGSILKSTEMIIHYQEHLLFLFQQVFNFRGVKANWNT